MELNEQAKQDHAVSMPTTYNPHDAEAKWYKFWMDNEFFTAGRRKDAPKYSVVIPPPNVTGMLHIGHALDFTLQDILVRMKRMQGYDTLWLPGTDHAGIATQTRVEQKLREEQGLSRYDLGRERFLEQVWAWKEQYADTIRQQWAKMGLSLDYSRERFTLDEGLSRAVREVFVRLYEKGLIYRGKYIINWDPAARTALSDIEVEYKEVQGRLYHLEYPLKDGSGKITVATTRPETMLGDTAVAVHPEDPRYKDLIGKTLILPIIGREIPIIADEYVDPEFGSGAVKITPAHDPNDFEVGLRHNLPQVLVMDESGKMNENAGRYQGHGPLRMPQTAGERPGGAGRSDQDRGTCSSGWPQRADRSRGRALSVHAVVRQDEAAGRSSDRSSAFGTRRQVRAGALREDLLELDRERPRLVYLPSAVVGAPHSGMVLRRLRRSNRIA